MKVSGGGTNLQALIDAEKRGKITSGRLKTIEITYAYRFDYRFEKGLLL